ncbi:MAG: hypothetical protein COS94_05220 [Candidatus Hydrogenedentes bacterium CG07_land_8_20_14_0_80_42_17]|nr:MAG: hypothetical protein COS94_05220 [Candidatus Hydrogenedentes bacterium CG07_land_8_20_14_0_80_42_17]
MKILRLIARLNVGGPAKHVILLTSVLKEDFETVLATGYVESNETEMTEFCREMNVTPVRIKGLGRSIGFQDIFALIRVIKLVLKINPDVIDTHTAKAGMLGRLSALILNLFRKKKIRIVHTYHGHVLHGYFSPLVSYIFLLIERFLGHFASDRIITISSQQRDELQNIYKVAQPDKFRIIPLGIDLTKFHYKEKWEPDAEIKIGLVGRLTSIKDPFLFLEAVRIAKEKENRIKAVIIGDGELRSELEKNCNGIAEFLGSRNDIEELMSSLDILVISSRNEGTPMSIIEAFAAGVPVVATAAGGVVDLCAEGRGLLSPIGDVNALAENILKIIRNPELAIEMRRKSLEFVKKFYSLERLQNDMKNIYKEL